MSCAFAREDGAYVLGALTPSERLEFEQHMSACEECSRAVRHLAGLPGLLRRVDSGVLTVPPAADPVPETLLPELARRARGVRLRRALAAAAAAAATTALVLGPPALSRLDGDEGSARPGSPAAGSPAAGTSARRMDPVGDVPVQAEIEVAAVTWGTQLELTCSYDTAWVSYRLPPEVDYVLVVRTEDGQVERVGSWRSVDGRTMRLTAGTAARTADISRVEVRTQDGRVVLTATA